MCFCISSCVFVYLFYLAGIAAILWLVVWSLLVSSTPGEQKHMSDKERDYILRTLKGQVSDSKSKVAMHMICTVMYCMLLSYIYVVTTNLSIYNC